MPWLGSIPTLPMPVPELCKHPYKIQGHTPRDQLQENCAITYIGGCMERTVLEYQIPYAGLSEVVVIVRSIQLSSSFDLQHGTFYPAAAPAQGADSAAAARLLLGDLLLRSRDILRRRWWCAARVGHKRSRTGPHRRGQLQPLCRVRCGPRGLGTAVRPAHGLHVRRGRVHGRWVRWVRWVLNRLDRVRRGRHRTRHVLRSHRKGSGSDAGMAGWMAGPLEPK